MKTRHCRARPRREGAPQNAHLHLRCHRDEIDGWRQAAQDRGLNLADYVREQMDGRKNKVRKEQR